MENLRDYKEILTHPTMDHRIEQFRKEGISQEDLDELADIADGDEALFRRVAQRRLFKEPMAYIRGYASFFGRNFDVDRRVYVPTIETEDMVRLLLDDVTNKSSILDVGTGSGSMAITVKLEKSDLEVYGCDISPSALEVARSNARKYNADVQFFESFYVDDVADINPPSHIISDMPWGDETYVLETNDLGEMKHMPPQAIFHPNGILEAYRELIDSIRRKRWETTLFFESGLIEESRVRDMIPRELDMEYVPFNNYSVTVVRFN